MIRTGLIGYGLGGMAFHAPLIDAVPELDLAAIVTSRADQVRERYPDMRVLPDAQALFADPSIELVAISTPNASHVALAEAALRAGKNVVIDKPITPYPSDGDALIALAKERRLVLSAFHNRRWDGDFLTVQKLIDSGRLGDLMLYEARWDRHRLHIRDSWKENPAEGTGSLLDLGPHLIDQALLLFGQPEALTADIAEQRPDSLVDDYFELTLHYGERRVILSASTLVSAARPRFGLHGTKASFVKYGLDPQEATLRDTRRTDGPRYGYEDPSTNGVLTFPDGAREIIATERGDYRAYYAGVARAILEGTAPPVEAADAVAGLRLIERARESAREGVRLDFA